MYWTKTEEAAQIIATDTMKTRPSVYGGAKRVEVGVVERKGEGPDGAASRFAMGGMGWPSQKNSVVAHRQLVVVAVDRGSARRIWSKRLRARTRYI